MLKDIGKEFVFVCVGGYVTSRNDGDVHYIGPHTVKALYKVPGIHQIRYCQDFHDREYHIYRGRKYIFLYPRSDGEYNLQDIVLKHITKWRNKK